MTVCFDKQLKNVKDLVFRCSNFKQEMVVINLHSNPDVLAANMKYRLTVSGRYLYKGISVIFQFLFSCSLIKSVYN